MKRHPPCRLSTPGSCICHGAPMAYLLVNRPEHGASPRAFPLQILFYIKPFDFGFFIFRLANLNSPEYCLTKMAGSRQIRERKGGCHPPLNATIQHSKPCRNLDTTLLYPCPILNPTLPYPWCNLRVRYIRQRVE